MTTIHFRLTDGSIQTVVAEEGVSIMKAAVQNAVPGIIGECGGELSCGTCHVYVEDRSLPLPHQSADEADMLESLETAKDCSRLSCQIRLCEALDGAEIVVAPEP